jgi:NAD(P)-dependent dehydrogenase (short-subunit alcohol dehydrogenase family)
MLLAGLAMLTRADVKGRLVQSTAAQMGFMLVACATGAFGLALVHVLGHAATARHAAAWWREQAKTGARPEARIVNTTSGAGLQGSVGQAAYSAAKGAVAVALVLELAFGARAGVGLSSA